MKSLRTKAFLAVFIIFLIVWMLNDTITQSGIEDLKGGFTEVAKYRNDNNTGPVQRIYAVTVKDTTGAQLQAYGELMPHTKYGNTKVYFFMEGSGAPKSLSPGNVNFDTKYNAYCFEKKKKIFTFKFH